MVPGQIHTAIVKFSMCVDDVSDWGSSLGGGANFYFS